MNEEEFEMLLVQARAHDTNALAKICEKYYPLLVKFIYYRANPQVAEDLAGEVILRLMKSIENQNGRFEPWSFALLEML